MTLEVTAQAEVPIPLDMAFRVEPGALLALVGPSGSGKTTLLRTIAGLYTPGGSARVTVAGQTWLDTGARVNLPPHRRAVGLVFQSYALFPHMSAAQNVMAAMTRPNEAEALHLLDLVNLTGLSTRKPAQLSGGQQQRVALARALARKPQALLLDEPFSAVDHATREKLYAEIIALRAHLNMPVVLVTHDLIEAQRLAERMVVIAAGRMVRDGSTAEVMSCPEALRVMGVQDIAALLQGRLVAHLPDGMSQLETAAGPLYVPRVDGLPGISVSVRIMAREVIIARARPEGLSAQNILAGQITRIVPGTGPGALVYIAIGQDEIIARVTRRAVAQLALEPGDTVHAIVKSLAVAPGNVTRAPVQG